MKIMLIHAPNLKSNRKIYCRVFFIRTYICLHSLSDHYGCTSIELVLSHRYLGIIIDHKLNKHEHNNYMCKLRTFLVNIYVYY